MSTIYALPIMAKEPMKSLIQSLCFGSCGKISLGGAINSDTAGPCFVCCEEKCPYSKEEVGPIGTSEITGDEVMIRIIQGEQCSQISAT